MYLDTIVFRYIDFQIYQFDQTNKYIEMKGVFNKSYRACLEST